MHSPLPWKVYTHKDGWNIHSADCFIAQTVFDPVLLEETRKTHRENARLIVKAVNSYAAMKEALEHIQNLAEENTHSPQDGYAMIEEWARKALKLAEGQSDDL